METPIVSVCAARSYLRNLAAAMAQHEQEAQVDDGADPGHVSSCPVISCQSLYALQQSPSAKLGVMQWLESYLARWPQGTPRPADMPVWNRCLVDTLLCVGKQFGVQLYCSTPVDSDGQASDGDSGDESVRYRTAAFLDALAAYYRYAVDELSNEALCSAGHITESPRCRSGFVRHLRDVFPVVDNWECDDFPDLLRLTETQRDAWSLCVCFVTVGLVGLAVGSDRLVAWSRDMLAWCDASEELVAMLHLPPEEDSESDGEGHQGEPDGSWQGDDC